MPTTKKRLSYRKIFDACCNGIIATDADGRIFLINRQAEKILALDKKTVRGAYISDILPHIGPLVIKCLKSGKPRLTRHVTGKGISLAVNIKKIEDFMGSVGRKFKIGLEAPEWKRETIEKVFSELDIIHIVNPFEEKPIKQKTNYYHLNGIGATMYRYRFKDADLERLKGMVKKKDYVLFNNIFLYEDSMRFMELSK